MHPRRKILTAIGATLCVTIGWLLYRNNWVINPSAHPAAEPVGANATLPGSNRQSQSDSIAAAANEKVRKAGDTAKESVYADWLRSITEALASRDDANSLAAAALLIHSAREDLDADSARHRMLQLLQRAIALAPTDASIQVLALRVCTGLTDCDPVPFEQSLHNIDPDNSVGWLGEVTRAALADNVAALRSALANMAKAKRYDSYWSTNGRASISRMVKRTRLSARASVRLDTENPELSAKSPCE